MMLLIGLTGNIGCGKSTVARVWESMGAFVVDADKVGHALLGPGSEALERVVIEFGEDVLGDDGRLDRERLAAVVFESEDSVRRLNGLVHPLIREEIIRILEKEENEGRNVAVVEAALLLEAGTGTDYDLIVVIEAPIEKRLGWLFEKRGLEKAAAIRIERMQMDPDRKAGMGDLVLENRGSARELESAAKLLFRKILEDFGIDIKDVDAR